jgi:hypothetical protein
MKRRLKAVKPLWVLTVSTRSRWTSRVPAMFTGGTLTPEVSEVTRTLLLHGDVLIPTDADSGSSAFSG